MGFCLGLSGLYLVLPGFTGLHRILLGFTEIT